ncbi:MAG: DUF72 domain-containing protein [Elusimicrobia bacterium]|nr:DUF72 domain-containing protein [Elusimicrobiota bacterium]
MIKVGTSGFSFADWKEKVYPAGLKKEDQLGFYENGLGFNAVELNFTYYALPSPAAVDGLSRKTSPQFEFAVKAYRGITHDPFDYRIKDKPREDDIRGYCEKFSFSLGPLKESGKLAAVLLQFPVFFCPSGKNTEYILKVREYLGSCPLAVEFRNSAWIREETFSFLEDNGISYCDVDEPRLPRLVPFTGRVTGDMAYVRFHGRNRNWFNSSLEKRYDYLYSEDELKEFVPAIKKMSESAPKTLCFFNNCHAGSAATNARMLKMMLEEGPPPSS